MSSFIVLDDKDSLLEHVDPVEPVLAHPALSK